MDLFIKTKNELYKINSNIKVVPYSDNYILPEEDRFYVLLIDNNYEVGYYKAKTDALNALKKIYFELDKTQFAVTNIIVYNLVGDDRDGLD